MSAHLDLVGLLRGELANADATASGRHLQECRTCRDDLVETAVGHGMLVRSAVATGGGSVEPSALTPLPDLEAAYPDRTAPAPRPRLRVLGAAAALALAAGAGAVLQAALAGDDAPDPQRSATLRAVAGAGGGTVSMLDADGRTSMTISTHDLPAANDGQFYYAWLLDPTTDKMLPLGQVGPSGTASFEVSDGLLAAYSAVDVCTRGRRRGSPALTDLGAPGDVRLRA